MRITKNGLVVNILLDEYFPCKNKSPCFSKAHGNELCVLILEKAWAKIHGSYDRIESGICCLALRDLTGAPSFYHNINKTKNLIEKIFEAKKYNFLICAGCNPKS